MGLITRRSRVQIPPPPPMKVQVRAGSQEPALLLSGHARAPLWSPPPEHVHGRPRRDPPSAKQTAQWASSLKVSNHRETPLARVTARPKPVVAAATFRAFPGAAPISSSFQKTPH